MREEMFGTLDAQKRCERSASMTRLNTEAMTFKGAQVLQLVYEVHSSARTASIPAALHPTTPSIGIWQLFVVPDSPWGPFKLLTQRLACRAGTRLRGFLTGALVDNEQAGQELEARWGYSCRIASIKFKSFYDQIGCIAVLDGVPVFGGKLVDPEPINGSEIFYTANVHLANTPRGLKLVQVDPEFVFQRAERGIPHLEDYQAHAFGDELVRPVWPVSASASQGDLTLSTLTYVSDPNIPALHGTEKLNEQD
jgi:hypothetical protein